LMTWTDGEVRRQPASRAGASVIARPRRPDRSRTFSPRPAVLRARAMSTRKKIALIGAGNIGGELAALVARKELGDVVLFDIPQKADFAKGKALDLEQNSAVLGYDAKITGTGDWKDCAGANVVIITAGISRKPGQSRDDLVATNLPIIRNVAANAKEHCPGAFVIVLSHHTA